MMSWQGHVPTGVWTVRPLRVLVRVACYRQRILATGGRGTDFPLLEVLINIS
jgi:hypothetical protein